MQIKKHKLPTLPTHVNPNKNFNKDNIQNIFSKSTNSDKFETNEWIQPNYLKLLPKEYTLYSDFNLPLEYEPIFYEKSIFNTPDSSNYSNTNNTNTVNNSNNFNSHDFIDLYNFNYNECFYLHYF